MNDEILENKDPLSRPTVHRSKSSFSILLSPVSCLVSPVSRLQSLLIPILFLAWSLFINHLAGPFYQNRSDPEYPYLLNGLNCATLDFKLIGHTDHPGTPFQILTGVFIRVTHLIAGEGTIAEDVFARPEMYLGFASFFLTILSFLVLWWLGSIAMRNRKDLTGALIMQSSFLLSSVLIDFPVRYTPDRLLAVYALIFIGLAYQYLYSGKNDEKRFMAASGILMGIGFATKFNFLPLVILPVIMVPKVRSWILYVTTFLITAFVSILPIIGKFSDFRKFISGVASHDGLYGQGSEQMINWEAFGNNIALIFKYNPAFALILALSAGTGIFLIISSVRRKARVKEILFLAGFWIATAAGFLMVAKHFKNYYFGPVLSLVGFVLLMLYRIFRENLSARTNSSKIPGALLALTALILALITVLPMNKDYRWRKMQVEQNRLTVDFMRRTIGPDDILLVEPTWMAGPMVENALVYGISYVAHRQHYYQILDKLYPNIVTWEGRDQPLRRFRTVDADPEALFRSGKPLYLFTSPGRFPADFIARIDSLAGHYAIALSRDTLFTNPFNQDMIIRYFHTDSWNLHKTSQDHSTGPIELDAGSRNSQVLIFSGVEKGDYFEATVQVRSSDPEGVQLILRSEHPDQDGVYFSDSQSLFDIGDDWKLLRLRARIVQQPDGGKMISHVYFPGKSTIQLKEFRCSMYVNR